MIENDFMGSKRDSSRVELYSIRHKNPLKKSHCSTESQRPNAKANVSDICDDKHERTNKLWKQFRRLHCVEYVE
ncbi:predicted protein [Botrytis cinerea T4]|uniref:Uncharacterized protein n=1 Tax=Botryotinia fuckeliana (strain T4) TaxID=999810 RepID=G2YH42_BOTF4|nr:predicted protein [Botrytis cinerea T4]